MSAEVIAVIVLFVLFGIVLGALLEHIIFKNKNTDPPFRTSKDFLGFIVEVITITLSCVLGFMITDLAENYSDKLEAKEVIESCVLLGNRSAQYSNLKLYAYIHQGEDDYPEEVSIDDVINTIHINTEYYDAILQNDLLVRKMDPDAYYYAFCYYDFYKKYVDKMLLARTDEDKYYYCCKIASSEYKIIDALEIALDKMDGVLTDAEVTEKLEQIEKGHKEEAVIKSYYERK